METRANYALIGAFTLAVMAAALAFVGWFSGADKRSGRSTVQIVFSTSVSGLSRGAQVLFNGLKVGEVTAIDLMPNDPSQVYAFIDIDKHTPLKSNTTARLEYQGLTGVASIALAGGTANAPELAGENGKPPVINAERSDFQNILETVQRLSGKTETVLDHVDKLVTDNSSSITQTFRNIQTFSQALNDSSGGIQDFLTGMADLGKTIKPLAANLDKLTGDLDARVTAVDPDAVKAIVGNAQQLTAKLNTTAGKLDDVLTNLNGFLATTDTKGVFGEVADAAKSIRKLADNLDQRTKDITTGINRFTGPGLKQYEALASDGRKTLDEINRTLRSLEKNPQQLIFGSKPAIPEYSGR